MNQTRPVKLGCVVGAKNCQLQWTKEYSWLVVEKAHLEFRFYSTSSRVQHKVSKPGGINEIPVEVFEAVASKGCGLGRLSGKVLFKLPIPIPCGKYEFSKPCP